MKGREGALRRGVVGGEGSRGTGPWKEEVEEREGALRRGAVERERNRREDQRRSVEE